ncbi:HAD family hydrolase [Leifsonia sp. McL0607]|uniref:HAD family hydrolase n=1 Tax=Leifsonia sp. McL0607 TaxID=3415672 RepID=UPI003CF5BDC2
MSDLHILALDIDGTLIGSDKRISSFTASEVRRVTQTEDVHVILVTARGPQSTALIEEQLGIASSYATFGGPCRRGFPWPRARPARTRAGPPGPGSKSSTTRVGLRSVSNRHCGTCSSSAADWASQTGVARSATTG